MSKPVERWALIDGKEQHFFSFPFQQAGLVQPHKTDLDYDA
jgi:hypothetical protein